MKQTMKLAAVVAIALSTVLVGCKKDDVAAPTVALVGNDATIDLGTAYTDAGATATDDRDGDLTKNIVAKGTVDNTKVGTYTTTYNVSDKAGNAAAEVKRTVKVKSDKLAGSYAVKDVVTGSSIPSGNGTFNSTQTIAQSSTEFNKILFTNFGGFASQTVYATIDGSVVTIPSQTVGVTGQSSTTTVSGSGTYDGATFKFKTANYSASGGLGSSSAEYTKQ